MDTVAFIPVRGGSKTIPYKNIKPLARKPLVHWTMNAALSCGGIDHLYVASEDQKVRDVARQLSCEKLSVIDRDPKTATDTASTESALLEFAENHTFETVVLIQATSPLLTDDDLSKALEAYEKSGADSLLSVVREHRFIWRPENGGAVAALNYDPTRRPRRQEWEGELIENGAFYITKRTALLESRCRISGRIIPYEMASAAALELDEPHEWELAEKRLGRHGSPIDLSERCQRVKMLISDVDGVLTDSGVFVGPEGEVCKKFSTRDGMGFGIWHRAGLRSAIMTSENSPIVTQRAAKLKVEKVFMGMPNKGETLEQLLSEEGLSLEDVLFIGDDINDLTAFTKVGLAACPADASDEIKAVAHYVCKARGGQGAVREVIDLVLAHRR